MVMSVWTFEADIAKRNVEVEVCGEMFDVCDGERKDGGGEGSRDDERSVR